MQRECRVARQAGSSRAGSGGGSQRWGPSWATAKWPSRATLHSAAVQPAAHHNSRPTQGCVLPARTPAAAAAGGDSDTAGPTHPAGTHRGPAAHPPGLTSTRSCSSRALPTAPGPTRPTAIGSVSMARRRAPAIHLEVALDGEGGWTGAERPGKASPVPTADEARAMSPGRPPKSRKCGGQSCCAAIAPATAALTAHSCQAVVRCRSAGPKRSSMQLGAAWAFGRYHLPRRSRCRGAHDRLSCAPSHSGLSSPANEPQSQLIVSCRSVSHMAAGQGLHAARCGDGGCRQAPAQWAPDIAGLWGVPPDGAAAAHRRAAVSAAAEAECAMGRACVLPWWLTTASGGRQLRAGQTSCAAQVVQHSWSAWAVHA